MPSFTPAKYKYLTTFERYSALSGGWALWLMLFNRDEPAKTADLRHTTLATARLRFLFLAAKIVRHAGTVLVRYSDHYAEQGTMARLMSRLRSITPSGSRYAPVLVSALRL